MRAVGHHHDDPFLRAHREVTQARGDALDDAEELRGLLTDTGFRDVRVSRHTHDVRAASAEAWAAAFLGAAPVPGLAEYDPKVLGRIADEVVAALRPYVKDDGLTFPISANVALARR